MKLEQQIIHEEEVFDDLEDFDLQEPVYQVWILGINNDETINDYSEYLFESSNSMEAIQYAKDFIENENYKTMQIDADKIEVVVETVVIYDSSEENIGTVFSEEINLKEDY